MAAIFSSQIFSLPFDFSLFFTSLRMHQEDMFQVVSLISKTTNDALIFHLPSNTTRNHLKSILNDHFNTSDFYKFYSAKPFSELGDVYEDEGKLEIFYEKVNVFNVDDDVLRVKDGYLLCRNGFYRGFKKISNLQKREFCVDSDQAAFLSEPDCIEVYDMKEPEGLCHNLEDNSYSHHVASVVRPTSDKEFILRGKQQFDKDIVAFILKNNILIVTCTDGSVYVIRNISMTDNQKQLLVRHNTPITLVDHSNDVFHLFSKDGTYLQYRYDERDAQASLTTKHYDMPVTAFMTNPLFVIATTSKLFIEDDKIELSIRYIKDVKTYFNRIYVCGQHRLIVIEQLKIVNDIKYENEIIGVTIVDGKVYLVEGNCVHEL
ncbi:hypothetical protein THOM_0106 [Trachipleistophora hominis]|uniref:Uncharacterized protein n=1 Tax=Trachipleistophora hominis TaxID=72359 RepID=L7K002_TRAHO|nr:hypothetical protein THOM_0106 [Trachipleistophora hominis]